MRFRSKLAFLEAEQWFPGKEIPGVYMETPEESLTTVVDGNGSCVFNQNPIMASSTRPGEPRAYVITIHSQRAFLAPGDWVCQEPTDPTRHYPCKPDVFAMRWERDEPIENGQTVGFVFRGFSKASEDGCFTVMRWWQHPSYGCTPEFQCVYGPFKDEESAHAWAKKKKQAENDNYNYLVEKMKKAEVEEA
jgi:hypothetical protein